MEIFTFLKKIADFGKIAQKNSYTYKVMPMIFQFQMGGGSWANGKNGHIQKSHQIGRWLFFDNKRRS